MNGAFIDTFYLLALLNSEDPHHDAAAGMRQVYRTGMVTTEYVLLEVLDALVEGPTRQLALNAVAAIREDANIIVVPASTALLEEGIALFASRPDKGWGITDCISFVVMQQHDLTDALTADRHFEQAGFTALLRK